MLFPGKTVIVFTVSGSASGLQCRFDHLPLSARTRWSPSDKPEKTHLGSPQGAVAQLLPVGQTPDFSVRGFNVTERAFGPLDKVYAELTGVKFTFPPGFDPLTDDPELVNPTTGEMHLGLIYVRRTIARDLVFDNEISEDLTRWQSAGGEVLTVSTTPNGDGTETVVICDALPSDSNAMCYLRVKVSRSLP